MSDLPQLKRKLRSNRTNLASEMPHKMRNNLMILTGKKHPNMKLQLLRKIRLWTFGSLVHQIKSF